MLDGALTYSTFWFRMGWRLYIQQYIKTSSVQFSYKLNLQMLRESLQYKTIINDYAPKYYVVAPSEKEWKK